MKKVLIIGGGFTSGKRMNRDSLAMMDMSIRYEENVTTIDSNPACNPTHCHDLNSSPWPVNDPIHTHSFDECHAYEILEHLGHQGNVWEFFQPFAECWWALKPGGLLFASCPSWRSLWAFGDPGHTRVINPGSLVFLQLSEYKKQLGRTAMSDYRNFLVGDWEHVNSEDDGTSFKFVMRAK